MIVRLIRSRHPNRHRSHRMVDNHLRYLPGNSNRPGKPDFCAGDFFDSLLVGQVRVGPAERLRQLLRIEIVVTTHQGRYHLFPRRINQRLYHISRLGLEKSAHRLDGPDVRRMYFFGRGGIAGGLLLRQWVDCRLFEVAGVGAVFGIDDSVLARFARHGKLVRTRPAHLARFGLHDNVFDPAPAKDSAVRVVHRHIALVECLRTVIETVRILHNEFTRADRPETGAKLIPEFRRNLIKVERKLLVRFHLPGHKRREHLFRRRSKHIHPPVTVFELEHRRPIVNASPRLVPKLLRLDRRHNNLLRPGQVHLLAHNCDNLKQTPPPQRQITVSPARNLPNQPRTNHQPMAKTLSIRRNFLNSRYKRLAVSHIFLVSRIIHQILRSVTRETAFIP